MLTPLLSLNLNKGVYILLVVLFFVFCVLACVLLFFGIRRDRRRLLAEKYKIKELDRQGFEELLKHKYDVATDDTHFSVMLVQIDGMTDMKSSLGERQVKKITQTLRERIVRVIPHGSKICDYDEEKLAVYIEEHMDNIGLTNIAMVTISECDKPVTLLTRAKLNINVNLGIASNNEFSADAVSMLQNIE
ncbi:MAG: diguanylate cyclase, partial [Clostridia bacterium]|nr:diguanylate cyclase [Clostridia bacterium]